MTQPHAYIIPMLQIHRRLPRESDSFGCAGQDDRSRLKGRSLREKRDGLADSKYLVAEFKKYIVKAA